MVKVSEVPMMQLREAPSTGDSLCFGSDMPERGLSLRV